MNRRDVLVAVSGIALMALCNAGCGKSRSDVRRENAEAALERPRVQIYVDASASMYSGEVLNPIYRRLIYKVVDAVSPKTYVEIFTFTNQNSQFYIRKVWDGVPDDSESIIKIVKYKVLPDKYSDLAKLIMENPGEYIKDPKIKTPKGTSLRGVLQYIGASSKKYPLKVAIISDGDIQIQGTGDKAKDNLAINEEIEETVRLSNSLVNKNSQETNAENINGIMILPVNTTGNTLTFLERKVFRDYKDRAILATEDNASEKIKAFARL